MKSSAVNVAESSLLLWVLAAVVLVMAVLVAMGWVRQGQMRPGLRRNWLPALIAGVTLGTGICAAVVLALSAEALPFPIGYRLREAPLLWGAAMLGCIPPMALLCNTHRWFATIASGAWLAAVAVYVQTGWVSAVGFRPGVNWRTDPMMFGGALMAIGLILALWLAFSERGQKSPRRQLWRLGSALLMGITLMAGQEVLLSNAGLLAQVGSVFRTELPAPILCLVLGVVVPLIYAMMLLDLRMRRSDQRREKRREHRRNRQSRGYGYSGGDSVLDTQMGDWLPSANTAKAASASNGPSPTPVVVSVAEAAAAEAKAAVDAGKLGPAATS
jgi:NO-binding membrane sensor protein with MHYT domain